MPEKVGADLALLKIRQEDAVDAPSEQSGQVGFSHTQRELPQVVTITHQHVEGVELYLVIVLAAVEPVEIRSSVHAKQDSFTVEDKRPDAHAKRGFNDQRISIAPVVTVARE